MFHDTLNIGGKDVYVVESHQGVLLPWAQIRRRLTTPPALLTLDHHTDTREAFLFHRFHATKNNGGEAAKIAMLPKMIDAVKWADDESVLQAVLELRNDEHIRTALLTDIIARAFVINHDSIISEPGVLYATRGVCATDCDKVPHDDDCNSRHSAQMLESVYLNRALDSLNAKALNDGVPAVEAEPYILDIDLDYFHAHSAITPRDVDTFYRLVKNAVAITIAKEPTYVMKCRDQGSSVTSVWLMDQMIQHLTNALT